MRIFAFILFAVSISAGAFACWGLFTASGQEQFDEMDGVIPLAAGVLCLAAFVGGALAARFRARRGRGFPVGPPGG